MVVYTRNDGKRNTNLQNIGSLPIVFYKIQPISTMTFLQVSKKIKRNSITLHGQDNQNSDVLNRIYTS